LELLRHPRNAIQIHAQLTGDGQTLELGLCALQHVEEEIKQGQDLAAILPQRLVELSVLEMLRNPKDAIQIHAQLTEVGLTLDLGLHALQHVKEVHKHQSDNATILPQLMVAHRALDLRAYPRHVTLTSAQCLQVQH